MMVREDGVTQNAALAQDTEIIQILDRRFAMTPVDLMELVYALRDMCLPPQTSLGGKIV